MNLSMHKYIKSPALIIILIVIICLPIVIATSLRSDDLLPAFPFTEDSFFYFYVARLISEGYFFENSFGEFINGFQPLYALLLTPVFSFIRAFEIENPYVPLRIIYLFQSIGLGVTAVLFGLVVDKVLVSWTNNPNSLPKSIRVGSGMLWFVASGKLMNFSLNGLETGLLIFLFLLILYLLLSDKDDSFKANILPFVLGMIVLARIDTLPFALTALILFKKSKWMGWRRLFFDIGIFSLICGWWFFLNYFKSGTPIPSSGLAYQLGTYKVDIFSNIEVVFRAIVASTPVTRHLLNRFFVTFGINNIWVTSIITICVFLGYIGILIALKRKNSCSKVKIKPQALVASLVYVGSIFIFYVFFWGASWFIPRYFAPLTVILNLIEICFLLRLVDRYLFSNKLILIGMIISVTWIYLAETIYRDLYNSYFHPEPIITYIDHYSLIDDLPENSKVASFQSGVLMYFRPTTINLDGKMNISSIQAIRNGTLYDYVLNKKIEYIVDWPSLVKHYLPTIFFEDYIEIETISGGGYNTTLWRFKE